MASQQQPDTLRILGFDLPNLRYKNSHIINYSYAWNTNLSQFPGFQNSFPFEDAFVPIGNEVQAASLAHWHTCLYISVVYLAVIFGIRTWMQDRKPYNLRTPLIVWNLFLAAFSVLGVYRCLPEFVHILTTEGLAASYTKASYYDDYRLSVWYLFFTLSKAFELVDTLFIVLRKSKLIALHWVHHVLTLTFSWFAFVDVPGTARWMVNMNFLVHSLMYTYYALAAMRIRLPKPVNLVITTLQVVQMFAGLYINYKCLQLKALGLPVDISYSTAAFSFGLYFIFTILFLNFFFWTYLYGPISRSRGLIAKLWVKLAATTSVKTHTSAADGGSPSVGSVVGNGHADINHNHYKGFVKKLQ